MPNVVVMTDNVACIPSDVAEKNRIKIVPTANILFDGKAYTEGIDITASEAYELITRDPDKFETSAAAPGILVDEYRKASVESNEILMITLSSTLSAFFSTACLAAEHFQKESPQTTIRIVDSRTCPERRAWWFWRWPKRQQRERISIGWLVSPNRSVKRQVD